MRDVAQKPKRIATSSPGVIEPQALYTVEEARRRLRIGQWAWRKWRRDGLLVLRVSGRAFVSGRTLIEFIEQKGGEQQPDD
jgi:hypothetical protein